MSNVKAFIPILLSIVIALGGSYYLYNWIKQRTAPDQVVTVKESKAIPVVTAKVDIPWGSRLNIEMLEVKPYLETSLPVGTHQKPEDIMDRIVVTPIRTGEPILDYRLAPESLESGGISAVLEPGMRAISVQGNRVLGIAGFINPGNRVDVLVTIEDPGKNDATISKIVLKNLLVLASGTQIIENSQGEPAPVDVYTLEVTPDQGDRLTLASKEGSLQFALRGATDNNPITTKGITVPELLDSVPEIKPEPVQKVAVAEPQKVIPKKKYKRPPKKSKAIIEIIKGLELTKEVVEL